MNVDVVAVSIDTKKVLWVESDLEPDDADAIIAMAVMRQGVEDRFFTKRPVGLYATGADYKAYPKDSSP
jgi:hypothetical protein